MDKETIKYYEMSAQSYLDKVCNINPDSDLLSFIKSIKLFIKLANEIFNVQAVKADFNELSDINLYDGVWANFSLLHAPRSEMLPNLIRIHKALKKKGYLHLGLKIGHGEKRDTLGRKYTYYQPEEINSLLISAGFTINTQRLDMDGTVSMTGAIEPFMIVTAYA